MVLNSLPNVQEHATPLAEAVVERGVEVHVTGDVENRAASVGCFVWSCSASVAVFNASSVQEQFRD